MFCRIWMFCQRDGFEQFGKFRYFDEIGCFVKEMVFVEFGCFVNEMVLNSYGNLDILKNLDGLLKR